MTNRKWIAVACFAAFIVLGIANATLGPTLPNLVAAVNIALKDAGILRAIRQIGSLIAVLGAGRLLDRREPRWIMLPGIFLMAASLLLLSASTSLGLALLASLLIGVGSGCIDVSANFLIGALFVGTASSALAALHTFFGVGSSLGPLIAGWTIAQVGDWRAAYAVAALLCVVVGLSFLGVRTRNAAVPPLPKPPPSTPVPTNPVASPEVAPLAARGLPWLALLPLMVLIFSYNGAGNGLGDWLFTHLKLVAGTDPDTGARITSLYYIGLTTGRLVSIGTLHRFGNQRVLAVSLLLATLGAALILFGGQLTLIALGVGLVGLGFAPVYPTVIAMGGHLLPQNRGTVTGLLSGTAALGSTLIPVVQGWIGGGQNGGMIVTLIASLVMLVTLFAMRYTGTTRSLSSVG